MHPLPAAAVKRLRESLAIEWTYHSNGIEGNRLSLAETRAVLEDGITIRGKSLREHFEAVNHFEALEWVQEQAQPGIALTEPMIRNVHALVLQKTDKENDVWFSRSSAVHEYITGRKRKRALNPKAKKRQANS